MRAGAYTAIVTPFTDHSVDYEGLDRLIEFQISNRIAGILAVGTTGESPTLTWDEHNAIVEQTSRRAKDRCLCIAGTGSNNTHETLAGTRHAANVGVDAVLLVDPYYNGPSSLEIRREYVEPVAREFPMIQIIPYVIPGRTGTQMLPEDLAILAENFQNVRTVKEATGNLDNMRRTRKVCGSDYTILSGDDGLTFEMMTDPEIQSTGVISVISNIAPGAVSDMVDALNQNNTDHAENLAQALSPLFDLVTVKTQEKTAYGNVTCRARNPLPVKTMMRILGMPSGPCRQPMGKMTQNGLEKVVAGLRQVWTNNPEILKPIAQHFHVDIEERINTPSNWKGLIYPEY
ncbi:MAG: 4-hydroxy-tetrahydrodipicolinate synthase [Desulfobacterales bacterium]|jgi:4-hydroxy-tetrahydrodipicolinate synthase|nr:4-hydroxy-tetrahydrodipicolinate synthase [Desulfobacterales bacterium]